MDPQIGVTGPGGVANSKHLVVTTVVPLQSEGDGLTSIDFLLQVSQFGGESPAEELVVASTTRVKSDFSPFGEIGYE